MSGPQKGPLAGVRVLELARILAGPWAGQTLADLGAEVIKVERPGAGDDTRGWGPPFMEDKDGGRLSSSYNLACNRGKRSIAIDFETPDGQRIVKKLAAKSDVLIENFKFGGLAKYGLDYKSLPQRTRGWSIARSPASARTGRTRPAPATTCSCRAWAASWTSPAIRPASRPGSASPSPTFSPAPIPRSPSPRRSRSASTPARAATSTWR